MPIRLPTIVLQVYQLRMRSRTGETRFWCGSIALMIWRAVYVRFWRTRPWPSGSALLVVRVCIRDEGAGRSSDTAQKGTSVTLGLGVNDTCPEALCNLHRPVGTAVVGDEELAVNAIVTKGT